MKRHIDLSKKIEGSDISAPRKKRVAADNVEPSGDRLSSSIPTRKDVLRVANDNYSLSKLTVEQILQYINHDGGVMKKSMLVLFRRGAA